MLKIGLSPISDISRQISPPTRIVAFDGLRGVAAAIVVLYHYLCLLHPTLSPQMSEQVHWTTATPIHVLWNGGYAVAVFFALSGFVMAAAADRRRNAVISTSVARYLRLALPAAASCILAWGWLTVFPDSTEALKDTLESPSFWLTYTYQQPILPIWYSAADGMAATFVRGYSRFNNVLWTMQIELVGSLAIFLLYALTNGVARLVSLAAAFGAILLVFSDAYMGFVLGAALYEAHRRDLFRSVPAYAPLAAVVAAIALGGPGDGSHLRLGLPQMPEQWQLGQSRGVVDALAAALLLYSVLTWQVLARFFARRIPLFLGRISFGLYLVHVPPLYTIVAWAYLQGAPGWVLGPTYAVGVLVLAWIFTLCIDEPSLKWISALRNWLQEFRWRRHGKRSA